MKIQDKYPDRELMLQAIEDRDDVFCPMYGGMCKVNCILFVDGKCSQFEGETNN